MRFVLLLVCLQLAACGAGSGDSSSDSDGKSTNGPSSSQLASSGPDSPPPDKSSPIAQIYSDNCASCHGADGTGGVAPSFKGLSQLRIRSGVARMPSGPKPLDCGAMSETTCRSELELYILNNFVSQVTSSSTPGSIQSSGASQSSRASQTSNQSSYASVSSAFSSITSQGQNSIGSASSVSGITPAQIFTTQCASCHGDKGQGMASGNVPALSNKSREQLLSGFERMPLDCKGLANCKSALADYILVNFSDGELPPPVKGGVKSTAIRLLSIKELQLSYHALTGIDPAVSASTTMPAESVSYAFERVVNSQTFGPAHLEGLKAMVDEVIDAIAEKKLLKQFSNSCPDSIMPSPVASSTTSYSGEEMPFFPDYLPEVNGRQINISSWDEAPYTYSSFTHQFSAPGEYEISVIFNAERPIASMGIFLDSVASEDFPNIKPLHTFTNVKAGGATLTTVISIPDANSHPIYYGQMRFSGGNNIVWQQVKVTGPIDANAGKNLDALDTCATAVIDYLGPRAFRKAQLTASQKNLLVNLYKKGVTDGGFWTGMRYMLRGIFLNPNFLFMVEVGTPTEVPGTYLLDQWEVASRLSYGLCRIPPDEALRNAANQGQLHNPNVIEVHARRLLESDCGRQTVDDFFERWLNLQKLPGLAKDPLVFPPYNATVAQGMQQETKRYLHELFWNEEADLRQVFTANYSWPDPASAFLYGLNKSVQEKTYLPADRAGVLTQPSVLSLTGSFAGADPVHRGVFVLRRILCQTLADPPSFIAPPVASDADPKSNRELWAEHSNNPACSSCHQKIDPIGFTFEAFNGIGQTISHDRFNFPIDARGGIPDLGIPDGSLNGAADLGHAIAESTQAKQCFATHWLRYTLGRLEIDVDDSSVANVTQDLETASMKEALIKFFKQSSFVYRFEELE